MFLRGGLYFTDPLKSLLVQNEYNSISKHPEG